MRKLTIALFALVLVLTSIGCDSNGGDDEMSVAELIADNWVLTSISDSEGDKTAIFTTGFDGIDATFTESGNFTLIVDSKLPGEDQTITGTWAVDETRNRLTLTAEIVPGFPVDLVFTYAFSGDDVLSLTASSATSTLLNTLLGTTLQGSIKITITRD